MLKTLVVIVAQLSGGPAVTHMPSDTEVLRAMPKFARGVPLVFEHHRDDIVIVRNLLVDRTIRISLPAGASASVSKQSWECVVYYTETVQSIYPVPVSTKKNRVQVIYLDRLNVAK